MAWEVAVDGSVLLKAEPTGDIQRGGGAFKGAAKGDVGGARVVSGLSACSRSMNRERMGRGWMSSTNIESTLWSLIYVSDLRRAPSK